MESFVWSKKFETGVQKVDDQYRKLVKLINSFGTQLTKNDIADHHVESLLQELVNYTHYYFEEEEGLMLRYGLDSRHCSQHLEAHKEFIADITSMRQRSKKKSEDDGKLLLGFLIHWVAHELQHSVRSDDIVCRMGGNEFLIICPNTPLEGALIVAELTREKIASLTVPAGDGFWSGSISVGVASNSKDICSVDDLLKAGDDAAYMAKK